MHNFSTIRRLALSHGIGTPGDPWGTLLQVEISYSRSPVKPPRRQTLRSPRPKVTSVPTRSLRCRAAPLFHIAAARGSALRGRPPGSGGRRRRRPGLTPWLLQFLSASFCILFCLFVLISCSIVVYLLFVYSFDVPFFPPGSCRLAGMGFGSRATSCFFCYKCYYFIICLFFSSLFGSRATPCVCLSLQQRLLQQRLQVGRRAPGAEHGAEALLSASLR